MTQWSVPIVIRHSAPLLCAVALLGMTTAAAAAEEWLSLGDPKSWSATIFSKSGIGTASAVAQARVTRKSIQGWCENWSPGDKQCVSGILKDLDLSTVYRAEANCQAGSIVPTTGGRYTLAGIWDNRDIGGGRSKWRDSKGAIVGRSTAAGGLAISQQWEVLCPGPLKLKPATAPAPAAPVSNLPFAIGDHVEARYGNAWIPARVQAIRHKRTANGIEANYDVVLINGKRGIVPARMLRHPGR